LTEKYGESLINNEEMVDRKKSLIYNGKSMVGYVEKCVGQRKKLCGFADAISPREGIETLYGIFKTIRKSMQ